MDELTFRGWLVFSIAWQSKSESNITGNALLLQKTKCHNLESRLKIKKDTQQFQRIALVSLLTDKFSLAALQLTRT
jgi:hypothetical protein